MIFLIKGNPRLPVSQFLQQRGRLHPALVRHSRGRTEPDRFLPSGTGLNLYHCECQASGEEDGSQSYHAAIYSRRKLSTPVPCSTFSLFVL